MHRSSLNEGSSRSYSHWIRPVVELCWNISTLRHICPLWKERNPNWPPCPDLRCCIDRCNSARIKTLFHRSSSLWRRNSLDTLWRFPVRSESPPEVFAPEEERREKVSFSRLDRINERCSSSSVLRFDSKHESLLREVHICTTIVRSRICNYRLQVRSALIVHNNPQLEYNLGRNSNSRREEKELDDTETKIDEFERTNRLDSTYTWLTLILITKDIDRLLVFFVANLREKKIRSIGKGKRTKRRIPMNRFSMSYRHLHCRNPSLLFARCSIDCSRIDRRCVNSSYLFSILIHQSSLCCFVTMVTTSVLSHSKSIEERISSNFPHFLSKFGEKCLQFFVWSGWRRWWWRQKMIGETRDQWSADQLSLGSKRNSRLLSFVFGVTLDRQKFLILQTLSFSEFDTCPSRFLSDHA